MIFNTVPVDSIGLPESLRGGREVVIGDRWSVLGTLGYPAPATLKRDHPALFNFADRFPGHVFALAQERLIVLDPPQARHLALGLSACAEKPGP